jgi:predicted RNase H-like HicB family nuclease
MPKESFMTAYVVILEEGKTNWSAYVPDLPGCVATGATRAEVLQHIREAIEFHVEGLKEDGEPVPPPTVSAELVKLPA